MSMIKGSSYQYAKILYIWPRMESNYLLNLGITFSTRHISGGSSHLIRILAELGHSTSVDSVVKLDTALARSQAEKNGTSRDCS